MSIHVDGPLILGRFPSRRPRLREHLSAPPPFTVPVGPRSYVWRPTEAATLLWVEAMDGGNPKEKVPHRDRIVMLKSPFHGEPTDVFKTEQRFAGLEFGEKGNLA